MPRQPGPWSSYVCFLHSWDGRCTPSHPTLVEMGSYEHFSRPSLESQSSRWSGIIGLSYCVRLLFLSLSLSLILMV
jgi:hypothetical protein